MTLSQARSTLSGALIVTRREVQDQMRDWRIIAPVIVLTLFFPLLMNFTAGQAVAFVAEYGAEIVGDRLIPFLLMVVGFFPISVSLVIALESFVGEKERYSLEPLLSSPLTDMQLYIGKTLAAMIPPLFAAYLGIAVYLSGLRLTLGWTGDPILVIQIVALTTVQALTMVSAAVVVSTQATSVRAANLLSSFIIIPFSLLIQGESMVMFWAQYDVLWWILFALLLLTLVLVRMGVQLFNREELLGKDIDEINLKAAWATFKTEFVGAGRGRGVGGWCWREVLPTLRRLGIPILMMAGALGVAIFIGYQHAPLYRLPVEAMNVRDLAARFGETLKTVGLHSTSGAVWIFFVNVRALALAAVLGMFSFGVLAVILLMAPLGLAGYFAGQMSVLGIPPALFLAGFILPHGLFEIPAAVLTGAAILRLGASVIAPPPGHTLGQGWLRALADWAKISLGVVIPLLVIAALVEVFITPLAAQQVLSAVGG
jgi:uncharacterized membrane protein SpoIIM required for sporulation/ABC-type transport system involved in multi-copper enzyme maturation permease subunit